MMEPEAEKQEMPSSHALAMNRSTSLSRCRRLIGAIKRSADSLPPKAEAEAADLVALYPLYSSGPNDGS